MDMQEANDTAETINKWSSGLTQAWEAIEKVWHGRIEGLSELGMISILPAFVVLSILLGFYLAAKYATRMVAKAMRGRVDETLGRFIEKLIYRGMIGAGILFVLNYFGFKSTSFAAVLAALGFAIGLAFQGTLSNFASGILLMVFRPFKVGDLVVAGGINARVYEIDLFTTVVDTPDNRRLIIPNSAIAGHTIENVTFHAERRVEVPVGVAYTADMDETRTALLQAISFIADVTIETEERVPQVLLVGFGASSVDWIVRVWTPTKDFSATRDRLVYAIKRQLDTAKIAIAFPQLDIHIDSPSQLQDILTSSGSTRQIPRRVEALKQRDAA
jgi:small conductance mechanosensitive channel